MEFTVGRFGEAADLDGFQRKLDKIHGEAIKHGGWIEPNKRENPPNATKSLKKIIRMKSGRKQHHDISNHIFSTCFIVLLLQKCLIKFLRTFSLKEE